MPSLSSPPTFDSSITSDPNAAAIEGAINSAIGVYEHTYSNPIDVSIYFQEGSGLGASGKINYVAQYPAFIGALANNQLISGQSDQASALASLLPFTNNNPVTGTPLIALDTANIKALGGPALQGFQANDGNYYDGVIALNTNLTAPGSPGSPMAFSLQAVAAHEIDEVLGLGSSLGQGFQFIPSPEDLYRYSGPGVRSYTTDPAAQAYFSIDGGNTLLAQFDNQNDGGDWGDWQSNPLPAGIQPQVQDAFATPFSNPSLGVELTALDVIGYNRQSVPEPSVLALQVGMLAPGALLRRRMRK
jgi:hypothetical protein